MAIMLVPTIFYLLTLQKALNRCSPECRAMNPGMVWLMLIPFFNIVWQFIIVLNMAKSLGRGIPEARHTPRTPTRAKPLAWSCASRYLLCGLIGLVCWIIYWVKIAGYSSKLATAPMPTAA